MDGRRAVRLWRRREAPAARPESVSVSHGSRRLQSPAHGRTRPRTSRVHGISLSRMTVERRQIVARTCQNVSSFTFDCILTETSTFQSHLPTTMIYLRDSAFIKAVRASKLLTVCFLRRPIKINRSGTHNQPKNRFFDDKN